MEKQEALITAKSSRYTVIHFLLKPIMIAFLFVVLLGLVLLIAGVPYAGFIFLGLLVLYLLVVVIRLLARKRLSVDVYSDRVVVTKHLSLQAVRSIVPLKNVTHYHVERRSLGSLFKYGSVVLFTTGGTKVVLESIGKIDSLQEVLYTQLATIWQLQ